MVHEPAEVGGEVMGPIVEADTAPLLDFLKRTQEFAELMMAEDEAAGLSDSPQSAKARRIAGDAEGAQIMIRNQRWFVTDRSYGQ